MATQRDRVYRSVEEKLRIFRRKWGFGGVSNARLLDNGDSVIKIEEDSIVAWSRLAVESQEVSI